MEISIISVTRSMYMANLSQLFIRSAVRVVYFIYRTPIEAMSRRPCPQHARFVTVTMEPSSKVEQS